MGYDLTVQGLIRKRADLAGEAAGLKDQLGARLSDLDALDRVIRIFKPDIDLADLPARPAPLALTGTRGEFQRFLIDQLRKANHPLTTHKLAEIVMRERGLDCADRIAFKLISHRCGHSLAKMRRAGKVVSRRVGSGALLEWDLVR
jgi:hypothetical protein